MEVVLEGISGAVAGRRVTIEYGQILTFGRTDKSDVAIADDFMSGVHYAVEYGPSGCKVVDRGSRNGTFLNDSPVADAMVVSGDKIRAGSSAFVVQFARTSAEAPAAAAPAPPPPAMRVATPGLSAAAFTPPPPPPAPKAAPPPPPPVAPRPVASFQRKPAVLTAGSWSFGRIPEGWEPLEGFGIQQSKNDGFQSNVVATEEHLAEGGTLQQFVEAQVTMMRQYLREPSIEAAMPPGIPGAEETVALDVRYTTKQGDSVIYKRVYARAGTAVGCLTLTSIERDLQAVLPAFRELIEETGFYPVKAQSA